MTAAPLVLAATSSFPTLDPVSFTAAYSPSVIVSCNPILESGVPCCIPNLVYIFIFLFFLDGTNPYLCWLHIFLRLEYFRVLIQTGSADNRFVQMPNYNY
jgi:hypothetical protein